MRESNRKKDTKIDHKRKWVFSLNLYFEPEVDETSLVIVFFFKLEKYFIHSKVVHLSNLILIAMGVGKI